MKKLKEEQTEQLMQIISTHYPNQQILHLTDGCNDLHQALFALTKERDFEYDLRTIEVKLDDLSSDVHPWFSMSQLNLVQDSTIKMPNVMRISL